MHLVREVGKCLAYPQSRFAVYHSRESQKVPIGAPPQTLHQLASFVTLCINALRHHLMHQCFVMDACIMSNSMQIVVIILICRRLSYHAYICNETSSTPEEGPSILFLNHL